MKARDILEGVGTALLLLFSYYVAFFHPRNHDLYHHGLPVTNLIGGVLIDLLAVSAVATLLLILIRHLPPSARQVTEAMFAGLMAWNIVNLGIQILYRFLLPVADMRARWSQCVFLIPLITGALAWFLPRFTSPATRAIRFFLVTLSFSALWIVPQLVRVALTHPAQPPAAYHPASIPATDTSHPRIIWILFDELSYHQAFDHPAPNLALPNFELLRSSSVSFSSLVPAGFRTEKVIPSLFMNRTFDEYSSTLGGQLSYLDASNKHWIKYNPASTLFGLAQQKGWNPAIDGWYNPYCQLLAPVLSACYWSPVVSMPMEQYGASESQSPLSDAAALPHQLAAELTNHKTTEEEMQIRAYRALMDHAGTLIQNDSLRFIYIHLPVPHPPGIYDRRLHTFRTSGTYLDNLVLADDTLGILMRQISASSLAANTTIIVTSDHSWRIMLYRNASTWTQEEEQASGGKFDDRPVLLVHFPGQRSAEEIRSALPEMLEHDMIAAMLNGQMNSQEQLVRWSSQLSPASPQLQAKAETN